MALLHVYVISRTRKLIQLSSNFTYSLEAVMANEKRNVTVNTLIACLKELQDFSYKTKQLARETNVKADKAFNLIFELGQRKMNLSDEEKRSLTVLLQKTYVPLKTNIECTACLYYMTLDNTIRRKRSAIQYILDDFDELFDALAFNGTLAAIKGSIEECAGILDDMIEELEGEYDSDEGPNVGIIGAPRPNVPDTHTWWPRAQSSY